MSRSGYVDDWDGDYDWSGLYTANLQRAVAGKRGQNFFRDLVTALDAMPQKRLIPNALVEEGSFCTLGALAAHRGVDVADIDVESYQHHKTLGKRLGIAKNLVAEVESENDDDFGYKVETPERRWQRMRDWAASQIKDLTP